MGYGPKGLNDWCDDALRIAREHGFTDATIGEDLMLMVTELAETMEDHRDGKSVTEVWYEEKVPAFDKQGKPFMVGDKPAFIAIRHQTMSSKDDFEQARDRHRAGCAGEDALQRAPTVQARQEAMSFLCRYCGHDMDSPSLHLCMERESDRSAESTVGLLYRLWTKAVGTPEYVKSEWQLLEARMLTLTKEAVQDALQRSKEIASQLPVQPSSEDALAVLKKIHERLHPFEKVDMMKFAVQQFAARLEGRLEGRRDMNLRTAALHSDVDEKWEAQNRAEGVELALMDLEYVAQEFSLNVKKTETKPERLPGPGECFRFTNPASLGVEPYEFDPLNVKCPTCLVDVAQYCCTIHRNYDPILVHESRAHLVRPKEKKP
jgi:hypothetical protein